VRPPTALLDHAVGEACAHVQGESLKAHAASLGWLLNSPITRAGSGHMSFWKSACAALVLLGAATPALPQGGPLASGAPVPLTPRGSETPSFDCAKAKTAAARLICADGELARLDGELGVAFQKRKVQIVAPDQAKFVADQIAWIRSRNTRCGLDGKGNAAIEAIASAQPCMANAIRERIAFLGQTVSEPMGIAPGLSSLPAAGPSIIISDKDAFYRCLKGELRNALHGNPDVGALPKQKKLIDGVEECFGFPEIPLDVLLGEQRRRHAWLNAWLAGPQRSSSANKGKRATD
jgi:uncharacterized protein YecT (DUF1311 family)